MTFVFLVGGRVAQVYELRRRQAAQRAILFGLTAALLLPASPVNAPIDLRSDTVTRPLAGDAPRDGRRRGGRRRPRRRPDDPPPGGAHRALLGKGDALFFPSGTQTNQSAIWFHCRRGTELIVEANAHVRHNEVAGVAGLSGTQVRPVATPDGVLTAELVRAALPPASPHWVRVSAIAIENTHNAAGGRIMPAATADAIGALAAEIGVPLHLDGARIWNAAAALGVPPERLARPARTVSVCFSKGLGAPVGSCLAFPAEARSELWEIRKRLGGGMRQSGILAAAALYALDHNLGRIGEDHANAKRLADGLRRHPGRRAAHARHEHPDARLAPGARRRRGRHREAQGPRRPA